MQFIKYTLPFLIPYILTLQPGRQYKGYCLSHLQKVSTKLGMVGKKGENKQFDSLKSKVKYAFKQTTRRGI